MKNEILNTIQDNMQTNRNPRTKIKCEEYENLNQKQTNRNPRTKIKYEK